MAIDISIIFTTEKTDHEIYQKLIPWHPLSIRSYNSLQEANYSIRELFKDDRVQFAVASEYCFIPTKPISETEWTSGLPQVIVSWGKDDQVDDLLFEFLQDVCFSTQELLQSKFGYYARVIEQLYVPETKPMQEQVPQYYELKTFYDKHRDWMFFQVNRASNEAPFTTIVKSYKENGMRPFFGQLFISKEWGLLKSDLDFMNDLYQAEYGEPICIKTLLAEHAEALVPRPGILPNEEPMLFRNSIDNLRKISNENDLIEFHK